MAGYIGSKTSVTQVDGYNRTEAESRYVNVTGDTMTGNLTTSGALQSATFSDGTTSVGSGYLTRGSAKAWVNFDGTGTITARDSLNLSSLTDNGTGDYTVNFTNAFSAADYGAVAGGRRGVGLSGFAPVVATFATGAFSVLTFDISNFADWDYVTSSAHGDLA